MNELEELREKVKYLEQRFEEVVEQSTRHYEMFCEVSKQLRNARDPAPLTRIKFGRMWAMARRSGFFAEKVGRKVRLTLMRTNLQKVFHNVMEAWQFVINEECDTDDFAPPPQPKPKKPKSKNKPCKNCGQLIYWKWDGKPLPFNADNHERHYCQEYYQRRQSFHDRIKQGGGVSVPF